jgi:hypothetical protein
MLPPPAIGVSGSSRAKTYGKPQGHQVVTVGFGSAFPHPSLSATMHSPKKTHFRES